jgi:hypothetical protein
VLGRAVATGNRYRDQVNTFIALGPPGLSVRAGISAIMACGRSQP